MIGVGCMTDLHYGDCLEVMRTMPDNSIDSVVTDPPYGISFMGKKWDYDVPTVEVWKECWRVLRPGGHILVACGTRTQHRMAVNIEDAGFEIRDLIAWVYGSGFPKSLNVGNGFGTALKPAMELWTLARKPLEGTVANNVLTHGTGALNIDGCRVGTEVETWPATRGYSRQDTGSPIKETQPTGAPPTGRFPANFIHDGSDEVLAGFPVTTSGKVTSDKDAYGNGSMFLNGVSNQNNQHGDSGSAARFFYCAKASKRDRNEGLDGFDAKDKPTLNGYARPSEGRTAPKNGSPQQNHHPTVKPTELMRYLCRLITPPNGTVLDPFMGSGSTGKGSVMEGFNFIGIEREAEYVAIAEARINNAGVQQSLLASQNV